MAKEFFEVCFTYKIDLPFNEARKALIEGLRDVEWYIDLKKEHEHASKSISEEEAKLEEANFKGAKVTASKAQKALEGYTEQLNEISEKLKTSKVGRLVPCPDNFRFALRIDPKLQKQPAFPDCFNMPCADNEIRMLLTIRSFGKANIQTLIWSLIEEDGSTFLEINSDNNLAASLYVETEKICNYLVDYAYNQTINEKKATFFNGEEMRTSSIVDEEAASNEQDEGSAVVGCLVLLPIVIAAFFIIWGFASAIIA